MGLIANKGSGQKIEPVNAGVHIAVCYGIIDLGTHMNPVYGKKQRKVLIQWELPDERIVVNKDGKDVEGPRVISKTYTLVLSERASLRKDLEAWRGKNFTEEELEGFDLKNVLGASCQIQIVHDTNKRGEQYAKITAIMAVPKGMNRPKGELPQVFFSFDDWDRGDLPAIPDWIVKRIEESDEYKGAGESDAAAGEGPRTEPEAEDGDSMPF